MRNVAIFAGGGVRIGGGDAAVGARTDLRLHPGVNGPPPTSLGVRVTFGTAKAVCPAGYQAVGGGVESENVLTVDVTDSTPLYGTEELPRIAGEGQHGSAGAWYGATHNTSTESMKMSATAICSPT